jgi:steroid delta-isomerase-like uncharacterized protein
MNRHEIATFLDERQDAWRLRDPSALARGHHDDGTVQSPIFGTIRGREAIESSYRELFRVFADWTLDKVENVIEDGRAVQILTVHGTHTGELFGVAGTGRRFTFQGVSYIEFKDGKIARERRLYDFTSMLLQLGVLKAKPK